MPEPFVCGSVHLSTARTWRGGENQLFLLARGLAARGHRVLIVAPKEAPLLERAGEAGLPARALTIRGEVDPAGTWRLARLLREVRPDILHLHDGHAVLPGQLAARVVRGRKLGVVAHRRTAFPLRGRWKFGGRVDKIVAISAAAREKALEAGIPAERVAVVFSGLEFPEPLARDAPEVRALRAELGIPHSAVLAAHAAALTTEKRQGDLIEAIAKTQSGVKGGVAPDVHLAIAGSGELAEALATRARAAGAEGRVHFLGFRRDLRALWAAADLAVFASEAEGLCTALIESQGAGLPGVVTRAGGMVEVVEENVTGTIVPVGAVEELARRIAELARDAGARARMGRAARERARRLFSADAMVDNTIRVYRSIRE